MARRIDKRGRELYHIVVKRSNPVRIGKKIVNNPARISKPSSGVIYLNKNNRDSIEKIFAATLLILFSILIIVDFITLFKSHLLTFIESF
ncbi:MAG: hypothetical protein AAF363_13705 [Bacteroidota bacterium]